MIGKTLNHFKVLDGLGKGGMGEVYVAEDSKLKRRVALKVLPEDVARDPARLDRFQREAESIAALNHPNIVTIYSIEEADGVRFLTMELVEGETLIQLIPSNGMDVESFIRFSAPVAEALSAAHEKGIIHRDLKPGNIMVSHEGRIKVLDFGLAKLMRDDSDPDSSRMETHANARRNCSGNYALHVAGADSGKKIGSTVGYFFSWNHFLRNDYRTPPLSRRHLG